MVSKKAKTFEKMIWHHVIVSPNPLVLLNRGAKAISLLFKTIYAQQHCVSVVYFHIHASKGTKRSSYTARVNPTTPARPANYEHNKEVSPNKTVRKRQACFVELELPQCMDQRTLPGQYREYMGDLL